MLLRFRVRNHRSIRDEEEISLVASSLKDNPDGLISTDAVKDHKLLPAVVVYGANASGKSNLVLALQAIRDHVRHSHSAGIPGGRITRHPFVLDADSVDTTTIFDIDFAINGVRYNYGFDISNSDIAEEWLFAFPRGKRSLMFHRERNVFKFGKSLRGKNKIISGMTRQNSLFLSAAAQFNHDSIMPIALFIARLSIANSEAANFILSFQPDESVTQERVTNFLNKIGTGICGARISDVESNDIKKKFVSGVRDALENNDAGAIADVFDPDSVKKLQFAHAGLDGNTYIDVEDESDGTRRLIFILPQVFQALDSGSVLIIDELNAHLHTQACEAVLRLFCDPKTNPKGAQLIATTHDTNLLSAEFLRRDQVWFADKDQDGATHFYPLTDIATHKGDNIQKGYLQGRYGAVPFSGPVSRLTKG